ncbi:hypothetical protein BLS_007068 [Venturia inaequalis]|uniref:RNA helicase n=1 Tax=Venturia inaequalis TaxID=5025 RepID=A0A8H3UB61_VENIN|nr:hypothetical protein BLS_007068 [Venturia inaequalis]
MADLPNQLNLSRMTLSQWGALLQQAHPVRTSPPSPLLPAAPPPSLVPSSPSKRVLRHGCKDYSDDDLIDFRSDSSEASHSTSVVEEEDVSRAEVQWDDEPSDWDHSDEDSEEGEFSENQGIEDLTSEVSPPEKESSSAVTPQDPYSFSTPISVNEPQGGFKNSRWAFPAAEKVDILISLQAQGQATAFSLSPPVFHPSALTPPTTTHPQHRSKGLPMMLQSTTGAITRPQHRSRGSPMKLQRTMGAGGLLLHPKPAAVAVAEVAAEGKPPSLHLNGPNTQASPRLPHVQAPKIASKSVPIPQGPKSAPIPRGPKISSNSVLVPHVAGTTYDSPTHLDYFIAPEVSSLVAEIVKNCGHLVQARVVQIDPDDGEIPQHKFHKSETMTAEEKAVRNKELAAHAKMLKRNLANTKIGIEITRSKSEMTVYQQRDRILLLIDANSVVVIAAATGSGKTTRLPQLILEKAIESDAGAECNIWVTQPRRLAAISVSRRVIKEHFDAGIMSVGHHVRYDVSLPRPGGSITYCTTGILLNRIQRRPDEVFDNISHIIVDEAHERDMLIDRLLALLKFHLFARKKAGLGFPKIIVSSATLDIGLFTNYFAQPMWKGGVRELVACPYLEIPGRMFPVEHTYLDDILLKLNEYPAASRAFMDRDKITKDFLSLNQEKRDSRGQLQHLAPQTDAQQSIVPAALVALTIAHIVGSSAEGAILVFLPGLDSINKVRESLEVNSPMLGADFNDKNRFRIVVLHSDMKDSNDEAFMKMTNGMRKIVLATNIAETSITIPDAVYVIDSGKHKSMAYDPEKGLSQLKCQWISQSSSRQRAGRSGRVQPGFYFAIFSKQIFDNMRPATQPEILRSELQEVCLQLAHQPLGSSVRMFLDSLIEPPDHKSVDAAFKALKDIGALTDDEEITSLGRVLASLPVHPGRAKMIVIGILFRCLDPMLILAAANSAKDVFVRPLEKRQLSKECRMRFSADSESDHIALINAFDEARTLAEKTGESKCRKFLNENYLHFNQWREASQTAELMEQILIDRPLIPWHEPGNGYWKYGSAELNSNSDNQDLVKALIIAGFHPNVAATHGGPTLRSRHAATIVMGSGSVNQDKMKLAKRGQLFAFSEITKAATGNAWTMRDNSAVSPLGVILFARKLEPVGNRKLLVDGWLQFYLPSEDSVTDLIHLKNIFDNVLGDAYTQLGGFQKHITADPLREKLFGAIGHALFLDTKAYEQWLSKQPTGNARSGGARGGGTRGRGARGGGVRGGGARGGGFRGGGVRGGRIG